jgi:hypothetical protein
MLFLFLLRTSFYALGYVTFTYINLLINFTLGFTLHLQQYSGEQDFAKLAELSGLESSKLTE